MSNKQPEDGSENLVGEQCLEVFHEIYGLSRKLSQEMPKLTGLLLEITNGIKPFNYAGEKYEVDWTKATGGDVEILTGVRDMMRLADANPVELRRRLSQLINWEYLEQQASDNVVEPQFGEDIGGKPVPKESLNEATDKILTAIAELESKRSSFFRKNLQ